MVADDLRDLGVVVHLREDALTDHGVLLHLTALFKREGTGLSRADPGGKTDLADVVDEAAQMGQLDLIL